MTKADLVSHIAKEVGITRKAAAAALGAFVGAIHDASHSLRMPSFC